MASRGIPLTPTARQEDIPETVIFTDTETTEDDDGNLTLLLGCYEVWRVDDKGLPAYQKESGDYHTEAGFYDILLANLPCRVIAHNWAFDAAVLRLGARDNMSRYGYDIDVGNGIYPAGGGQYAPFLVRLNFDDGKSAEFLCNTNYYKMPLAVIGDSLGLDKLEMPPITDIPAMLIYCRRDVEILRMAYFSLYVFTDELAGVTPGITAAMASNRVFRKGYYDKKKKVQGTQHLEYVNNAERAAYHGGRTDVFYKGVPTSETVYKYDVNSLYPYCMLGSMPIRYIQRGRPEWAAAMIERDGIGSDSAIQFLADVTLHIPPESRYGFLGLEGVKRDKGDLIFPVGRFRCWLWQPLMAIAVEQGYVETVHNVFLYDAEPIFDTYINQMFALRVEYKKNGNKAYDILTKLMMNSLYGKFAQRVNDSWEAVDPESDEYSVMSYTGNGDMIRFTGEMDGRESEYWQIADTLYACRIPDGRPLARASVCSIAGYITARGRATLWTALAAVLDAGGTPYMCDTDSVVSDCPLPGSMVDPLALGQFKLEDIVPGADTRFYAPKHYYMGGKLVLKGVRNPTQNAWHPQTVFPNFMTDLMSRNDHRRSRLETGAKVSHIVKRPTGLNTKRVEIGESMPTLPIVVGY